MKYEDVSWHAGGEFPKDLPEEAAATHTGMYLAWVLLAGLGNAEFQDQLPERLARLRSRAVTPGQFFFDETDGKFVDEELNDEGNAFTVVYFDPNKGRYLEDYGATLVGELPSAYHVADTWANFDRLKPVLDRRLDEWRRGALRPRRPWWKFWGD